MGSHHAILLHFIFYFLDIPKNFASPCGQLSHNLLNTAEEPTDVDIPWAATITTTDGEEDITVTSAVLISPSIIMSAASYFTPNQIFQIYPFEKYFATVGLHKFPSLSEEPEDGAQKIGISHVSVHPKYSMGNQTKVENNYVLFHLKKPVNITNTVQPICLPENNQEAQDMIRFNTSIINTGWNRLSPNRPQLLPMNILSGIECQNRWEMAHTGLKYANRFCTHISKDNKNGQCIMKHISPMKLVNGSYYLVGQMSWYLTQYARGICPPEEAFYYFLSINPHTLSWIRNSQRCGPYEFSCGIGKCIPLSKLCNRMNDCDDGTDENELFCRNLYQCNPGEFYCTKSANRGRKCIANVQVNDGLEDCAGGEDEEINPVKTTINVEDSTLTGYVVAGVAGIIFLVLIASLISQLCIKNGMHENLVGVSASSCYEGASSQSVSIPDIMITTPPNSNCPWKSQPFLECLGFVGSGSYGKVFQANDISDIHNPTGYVIKSINISNHLENVGRCIHPRNIFATLLDEINILSKLNSDHVVRYFGSWAEKNDGSQVLSKCELEKYIRYLAENPLSSTANAMSHIFIKMELCDFTLKSWLKEERRIKREEFLNIAKQITKGVKHIHKKGYIHRDLKPANILCRHIRETRNSTMWKIGDFGLAMKLDPNLEKSDTASKMGIVGTKEYRSPEMNSGKQYNFKTDVYSLGLIFLELVQNMGETFNSKGVFDQLGKIERGEDRFRCIQEVANGENPQFLRVIWQMLDVSDQQRCSILQVLDLLDDIRLYE